MGAHQPKAIDLFAGPGGLSLGLKEAGFDMIAAVELDGDAGETYRNNIGSHTYEKDLTKFGPKDLRKKLEEAEGGLKPDDEIELVAGGPPCPGFSLIGRSKIMDLIKKGEYGESSDSRHGFIDDPRNSLFREFVKYVEEFNPAYFIMENVSGMASYNLDGDPVIGVIKESFGSNYIVKEKILTASDFGVPQERKRIIFLGSRVGMKECHFPTPTHAGNKLTALDAIRDLWDQVETDNGEVRVRDSYSDSAGAQFRKRMRNWACTREGGEVVRSKDGRKTCHWTRIVNERDRVLFPFIKSGAKGEKRGAINIPDSIPRQIYGDIFPSRWDSDLKPAFKEAGLKAWKSGGRHRVKDPATGKEWVMYPAIGFRDKMRRIKWNQPAPTIVAHLAKDGYMFIHPVHDRTITVREAARFQSFPDSFKFEGSKASQFRQVGNAVPPLLSEALGKVVLEAINQSD